jgi:hypothetical protein
MSLFVTSVLALLLPEVILTPVILRPKEKDSFQKVLLQRHVHFLCFYQNSFASAFSRAS